MRLTERSHINVAGDPGLAGAAGHGIQLHHLTAGIRTTYVGYEVAVHHDGMAGTRRVDARGDVVNPIARDRDVGRAAVDIDPLGRLFTGLPTGPDFAIPDDHIRHAADNDARA